MQICGKVCIEYRRYFSTWNLPVSAEYDIGVSQAGVSRKERAISALKILYVCEFISEFVSQ